MIPQPGKGLKDLAGRIAMFLAPQIPNAYGATDAGIISMLLNLLAREMESGISRRMTDITELGELFATASSAPGHAERQAFANGAPDSLELDSVSQWHNRGFELLIELHRWAELEDPALNGAIWAFLHRHTERSKHDL